jgi:hypothetical protein
VIIHPFTREFMMLPIRNVDSRTLIIVRVRNYKIMTEDTPYWTVIIWLKR